jgi:hypothetical protein
VIRCAALRAQQTLRDLGALMALAEQVDWIDHDQAAGVAEPLIVCGLWLAQQAADASKVLRTRSHAGRTTLVVPRFQAGNLAPVLQAPADIEIVSGEYRTLLWDEQPYAVPGVSVFQTTLHAGKWATAAGLGTALLAYRPHAGAGAVVLCSAAVTGRPLGVDREAQRSLLQRILVEAAAGIAAAEEIASREDTARPAENATAFLEQEREPGAAVLLACIASSSREVSAVRTAARDLLSLDLEQGEVERLLARLPPLGATALRQALTETGWGPFLRRVDATREGGAKA